MALACTPGEIRAQVPRQGDGKPGITLEGTEGQNIYATANGTVVFSGKGPIGYGKLILIQHKGNFLSSYGHNSELLVKKGEKVTGGEAIALMGSTSAAQPQLHFELRYKGKPVDPMHYLAKP